MKPVRIWTKAEGLDGKEWIEFQENKYYIWKFENETCGGSFPVDFEFCREKFAESGRTFVPAESAQDLHLPTGKGYWFKGGDSTIDKNWEPCPIDFVAEQIRAYPFLDTYYHPPQTRRSTMAAKENSVALKVTAAIAELSPAVEAQVVETLVQREIDRRADALVKVIDNHAKLERDLLKIKPDQKQLDEAGKELSATYSQAKFDERKKLLEKIEKHANAVNKALEKKDYSDVYNLANNVADKSGKDQGTGDGETK